MSATLTNKILFTPTNTGGLYVEAETSDTVDNIFVFADSNGKKFRLQRQSANGEYYSSWGKLGSLSDATSALMAIMNHASVLTVVIDSPVTINSSMDVRNISCKLKFIYGGILTGTGTAGFYWSQIESDKNQIFGESLTVAGFYPNKPLVPEHFGAFPNGQPCHVAFQKMINSVYLNGEPNPTKWAAEIDVSSGLYALGNTLYFRNITPVFKGGAGVAGISTGSGFQIIKNITNITQAPLAPTQHYAFHSGQIFLPPIGDVNVTFTGVTAGTKVWFYVSKDAGLSYTSTSFIYNGPNQLVDHGVMIEGNDTVLFSLSYIDEYYLASALFTNTIGQTAKFGVRHNISGATITSLTVADITVISTPLAANTDSLNVLPAYGAVPPYTVTTTLSGVANGTNLIATLIRDGIIINETGFTYNGADTVIMINYVPTETCNGSSTGLTNTVLQEVIVIGSATPAASIGESKAYALARAILLVNNMSSGNIVDLKFNGINQFVKPFWNGKSVFDIAGCDKYEMQDVTIKAESYLDPTQMPYSAVHIWTDSRTVPGNYATQREHRYNKVVFSINFNGTAGDWRKSKGFFANICIDGPNTNNDFMYFKHIRFEGAYHGYYNVSGQAVEHNHEECTWATCHWCYTQKSSSFYIFKAFPEYGIMGGFINSLGSGALTGTITGFTTEGIDGRYFIKGATADTTDLKLINSQIVFKNSLGNTEKDYYIITSGGISNVDFDGGNFILSNIGNQGSFLGAKAVMYGGGQVAQNKLTLKNIYAGSGQLSAFSILRKTIAMVELDITTSGSFFSQTRYGLRPEADIWHNLGNVPRASVSTLCSYNNTSYTHNARTLKIGDSNRSPAMGLSTKGYTFIGIFSLYKQYIPAVLPANTLIKGVSFATTIPNFIQNPADPNSTGFFTSLRRLFIGDFYDYRRFGYIDNLSSPQRMIGGMVPIKYDQNESLVFTAVTYAPATTLASGLITLTNNIGTSTGASIIGRYLRFSDGSNFEGLRVTVTGIPAINQIQTDANVSLSQSGNFYIEIEAYIAANTVTAGLIGIHTEENNLDSRFAEYELLTAANDQVNGLAL